MLTEARVGIIVFPTCYSRAVPSRGPVWCIPLLPPLLLPSSVAKYTPPGGVGLDSCPFLPVCCTCLQGQDSRVGGRATGMRTHYSAFTHYAHTTEITAGHLAARKGGLTCRQLAGA